MGWDLESISRLKNAVDIVQLANRFGAKLQSAESLGLPANIQVGRCPYHQPKDHPFFVDAAKQQFYCFAGNKDFSLVGDVLDLCYNVWGVGTTFDGIIKELAKVYEINLAIVTPETAGRNLNQQAQLYFKEELFRSDTAYDYLRSVRGLTDSTIRTWGLGYAPNSPGLIDCLLSQGFYIEQIAARGLAKSRQHKSLINSDYWCYFRDRIMVPIKDHLGNIVGFSGRDLGGKAEAKYLNSPAYSDFGRTGYDKKSIVFGLSSARSAIKKSGLAKLTEGYFDVISAHQAGLENVVAVAGTAFTAQQAGLLKRYASELNFLMDGDLAGIKAAKKAAKMAYAVGFTPTFSLLPEGRDLDDFLKKEGPFATVKLEQLGKIDLIDFALQTSSNPQTPDQRTAILEELVELMHSSNDYGRKIIWLGEIADRLRIDRRAVEEGYFRHLDRSRTKRNSLSLAEPTRMRDVAALYLAGLLTVPPDYARMVTEGIPPSSSVFSPGLREVYELIIAETKQEERQLPFGFRPSGGSTLDLWTKQNIDRICAIFRQKRTEGVLKHYPAEIISLLRKPLRLDLRTSSSILASHIKNEEKDRLIAELHQALADRNLLAINRLRGILGEQL